MILATSPRRVGRHRRVIVEMRRLGRESRNCQMRCGQRTSSFDALKMVSFDLINYGSSDLSNKWVILFPRKRQAACSESPNKDDTRRYRLNRVDTSGGDNHRPNNVLTPSCTPLRSRIGLTLGGWPARARLRRRTSREGGESHPAFFDADSSTRVGCSRLCSTARLRRAESELPEERGADEEFQERARGQAADDDGGHPPVELTAWQLTLGRRGRRRQRPPLDAMPRPGGREARCPSGATRQRFLSGRCISASFNSSSA